MSAPKCWVCLGTGWVKGPLHSAPCPNPHCPHKRREARQRRGKIRAASLVSCLIASLVAGCTGGTAAPPPLPAFTNDLAGRQVIYGRQAWVFDSGEPLTVQVLQADAVTGPSRWFVVSIVSQGRGYLMQLKAAMEYRQVERTWILLDVVPLALTVNSIGGVETVPQAPRAPQQRPSSPITIEVPQPKPPGAITIPAPESNPAPALPNDPPRSSLPPAPKQERSDPITIPGDEMPAPVLPKSRSIRPLPPRAPLTPLRPDEGELSDPITNEPLPWEETPPGVPVPVLPTE